MTRNGPLENIPAQRPPATLAGAAEAAFLPLLVAAYGLAAVAPAPLTITLFPFGVTASQLILAGLLFVAGLRMSVVGSRMALMTGTGLAAIGLLGRLAVLAFTVATTRILREVGCSTAVSDTLAGLTLVAAMPSANTSTAWTRRGGGNLGLCVAIVVCTTVASPAVVPAALRLAGVTQAAVAGNFSGIAVGVIAWVVVPMAAGMIVGRLPWRSERRPTEPPMPSGSLLSLGSLLLLNYLNASRAMPDLLACGTVEPLFLAVIGGLSLVSLLNGCGAAAGSLAGESEASRIAVLHAVGMSNTALAGTLAIEFFPDRPQILYPAMACTLFQHVFAAWLTISSPSRTVTR